MRAGRGTGDLIVESGLCVRSLQMDYDDDVANQSGQWLYDHARRPQRKPFLPVGSFTHSHNPFTSAREYWDLYDHGEELGERGMWFKFNPYEQSVKVPPLIQALGAKVGQRFNPGLIKQKVLACQRRRLFLPSTLTKGAYTPWDFQVRRECRYSADNGFRMRLRHWPRARPVPRR